MMGFAEIRRGQVHPEPGRLKTLQMSFLSPQVCWEISHAVDQRSKRALDDYIALVFMGPHSHDLLYVLELHNGS